MKSIKKNLIFCCIILFSQCTDEYFENFYEDKRTNIEAASVIEYLESNSEFSTFVECLRQTGLYDKITDLASVTVYAVDNSQMNYIRQLDTDSMQMYMGNHLSYGRFFENDLLKNSRVLMLNDKYVNITTENSKPVLDGINVIEIDILTGNGVIHVMESSFELKKNIYETILELPDNFSIIKNYILDADTLIFDRSNSAPIGVNETGNTIYDSVWIRRNKVLMGVKGDDVRKENEFFTAFIPENDVITNAITSVRENYLQATGSPFEEELDKYLYEWCHESLFYNGKVKNVKADTMLTLINDAMYLLSVQQVNENSKQLASNGAIYFVDYLHVPKYLWLEEFKITPRLIVRMDPETRDKYRTIFNGHEELGPGEGWYDLYSFVGSTYRWASFKTFIYDENDELRDLAIIPGEYDIYVKSSIEAYGIWTLPGWQEVWLNDKRLCDREYPAFEFANCTNEGYYLGRDALPEEWGVAQAELKIVWLRNGPNVANRMLFDWIKFIPTRNNY